jgi:ring-1,2-phenylacetyl-CoA epoxidase subunit PaaC
MSEVTVNSIVKKPIINLLYQLADDDFLYAYRNSEWLGLAPHIEEDVASSSISQDSMGHAAMFYKLLEALGEGNADDLAHARPAQERKNCILVEKVNGPGNYMENPEYDWAYAVVRNYLYTTAKKIKIQSLKQSAYQPLADVAVKVEMEIHYHLLHWKTWFIQLLSSTEEAKERMQVAFEKVINDFSDVFSFGEEAEQISAYKLIEKESVLKEKWILTIGPVLESVNISLPEGFDQGSINGRNGEHTEELEEALSILAEVYDLNPAASW